MGAACPHPSSAQAAAGEKLQQEDKGSKCQLLRHTASVPNSKWSVFGVRRES